MTKSLLIIVLFCGLLGGCSSLLIVRDCERVENKIGLWVCEVDE